MPKIYGQRCPVAKTLEVVGDRWTLLVIRDLLGGTRPREPAVLLRPSAARGVRADGQGARARHGGGRPRGVGNAPRGQRRPPGPQGFGEGGSARLLPRRQRRARRAELDPRQARLFRKSPTARLKASG